MGGIPIRSGREQSSDDGSERPDGELFMARRIDSSSFWLHFDDIEFVTLIKSSYFLIKKVRRPMRENLSIFIVKSKEGGE